MKNYASQDLRNICFVGSQGEGKTSIAEAVMFNANVTTRQGKVEEGNTVCDFSDEEVHRKISINLSIAFLEYQNKKINILVSPGYADFIGEMISGLAVAETAVFTIGADAGLSPAGENVWEYLEEIKIPSVIFMNKLDKDNIDFEKVFSGLKEKLGAQVVPVTVPDATGAGFTSVANLCDDNVPDFAKPYREMFLEAVSSTDDALTEKYLEGKPLSSQELRTALQNAIKERKILPLISGSAVKNIGIKEFMNFVCDYLPCPLIPENETSFSALCFKSVNESGLGHVNYVKIHSGSIEHGKDTYNLTRSVNERIGQMCYVQGKKKTDINAATAGDIVGFFKLKDTRTNDILGDPKNKHSVNHFNLPSVLYERAISAKSKGEEEKLGNALSILALENPTMKYHYNNETKEMVIGGMGALQLDIIVQKIKARFGVDIELKPPRIPYKETIHGKSEVQGKYKRQSGGHGQYGDCWLKIEPIQRGQGFEYVDKIVGGVIPKNFIPSIEKGVKDAMEHGVIAGYPVIDVKVTVFDGSYHDVDSSDMAFKIAGAMAFRKGFAEARPSLLEPIMNIEVTVPEPYMGAVMGDLNSKRGRVLGTDKIGNREIIKAQAPLSELFQYATDLRSLTKGSGKFSMKLSHYEDTPPQIAQPLIDAFQKSRAAEVEK